MATATHIPTKLMKAQGGITAAGAVNLGNTTASMFKVFAMKAGSNIPDTSKTGIQFLGDIANAENTNFYNSVRPALTGISWDFDGSGTTFVDWSFSNLTIAQTASDDGTTRYFAIYYLGTGTNDATYPVVAILDPGQAVLITNGSLTIQCPTGGLIEFTGGG